MCEGSQEPRDVQDVQLNQLFPNSSNAGLADQDVQAGIGCRVNVLPSCEVRAWKGPWNSVNLHPHP